MILYLRTTMDKYELPVAVADTGVELARILHTTPETVYSSISHQRKGWFRVEVEEKDEN